VCLGRLAECDPAAPGPVVLRDPGLVLPPGAVRRVTFVAGRYGLTVVRSPSAAAVAGFRVDTAVSVDAGSSDEDGESTAQRYYDFNPDTERLADMVAEATAGPLVGSLFLQRGSLFVISDDTPRAVGVAQAFAAASRFAGAPQACRAGLLTDPDDGYENRPVWICVRVGVPATSPASPISVNVITFVDAESGEVLFSLQDTA